MKKLNVLKSERASKIEKMNAVLTIVEGEKRSRTEDETTEWNTLDNEIKALDSDIAMSERQEELNKQIATMRASSQEDKELEVLTKRYDLSKAIQEFPSGQLSGVEKEMHQYGMSAYRSAGVIAKGLIVPQDVLSKRATIDKTVGADHIKIDVAGLDVVAPASLYQTLGVTVFNNLQGKLKLNFSDGYEAAFVDEGAAAPESTYADASATLTARRVQGWKLFSNEYLGESSVMGEMLADMIASIDRALTKEVLDSAVLANILTGRGTGDAAAALTFADVVSLQADLETEAFMSPRYVASKPLYHNLQTTKIDAGSGIMIAEDGEMAGFDAHGSTLLPGSAGPVYDLVFGDWRRAYIGFFSGGVELLIDPFTASNTGETKITFSRLADTAVNPNAFASIRNGDLA